MAKKTRKAVKPNRPMIAQPPATAQEAPAAPPTAAARPRPAGAAPARTLSMAQAAVTFREEYHYVIADLRRTAILAAAMFVAMIALALILAR